MHALLLVSLLALDVAQARSALGELEAMCRADEGRLWGRTVCGPAMIVDPKTRRAVTREGEAVLPESIGIANTAVEWNGERWTMVMAPLPEEAMARRVLLAHESFHRIQQELGFPVTGPSNAHLDSLEGRYWLRLEWRALRKALTDKAQRKQAVADALAFRAKRRALIATAATEEQQLEMHEGLAEYTGTALAEPTVQRRAPWVAKQLAAADGKEGYVRNFAYTSGPAWGAVLDLRDERWTRRLRASDDLGELARRAWGIDDLSAVNPEAYGGAELRAAETARDERRRGELAKLRERYVDGPVLVLPLRQFQMQMDPNGLTPLGDAGTVYRTITVTDAWGKIVVTSGALMAADFTKLIVPRDGDYTLTLAEGWRKTKGAREGDLILTKE